MSIYNMMTDLSKLALKRSEKYNGGSQNYGFAFGWLVAEIQADLDDMGLTKKQLKVLEDRINKLSRIVEVQ